MNRSTIFENPLMQQAARWCVTAILLAGLAELCMGQQRSRDPLRRGLRGSTSRIVQLPEPTPTGSVSFEQALVKKRAVRQFTGQPLKFAQIGQLAWAGLGTRESEEVLATPAAAQIYPIRLFFATQSGLYLYNPDEHCLEQISAQDIRGTLARLKQEMTTGVGCEIIIAGSTRNLAGRYGNRAGRYMLLQAGHIAQNIQLQTVSLHLGSVAIADFDTRGLSRLCNLPRTWEPLYMISVGYPVSQAPAEAPEGQPTVGPQEPPQAGRKTAVLIVASQNFRDEELFETRRALDMMRVATVVASSRTGVVRGMLGGMAEATVHIQQLRVDDYDAVVFIGGPGAAEYFDNPVALSIAREAARKGKVLAAICVAPTILANAGILTGVRATCFATERDRLTQAGAIFTGTAVEQDKLIITARDPLAANQFGRAIAEALTGG
jgi:protease I